MWPRTHVCNEICSGCLEADFGVGVTLDGEIQKCQIGVRYCDLEIEVKVQREVTKFELAASRPIPKS